MLLANLVEMFFGFPQLVITLIFGIPIVAIVGHYVFQGYKTHRETELKHRMLDQGMSADEIERILHATAPDPDKKGGDKEEAPQPTHTYRP